MRLQPLITKLLVTLPCIVLVLHITSWLEFGIDLPVSDDWRPLIDTIPGSLHLADLFAVENDTLYPIGKLLDALAYRYLNGNTLAYQTLSMILILGSLLLLQWHLLTWATSSQIIAGCSFALSILMVQPGTYWGLQNMAYHQAIPLVCILSTLALTVFYPDTSKLRNVGIIVLGFISGFSYVSGAVAMLALALSLLLFGKLLANSLRARAVTAGFMLLIPAVLTTMTQVLAIATVQGGTHIREAPLALPDSLNFWLFLLGKIARAAALPQGFPALSLIVAMILMMVSMWVVLHFVRMASSSDNTEPAQVRVGFIFTMLAAAIFCYLLVIAAGRTNYRPAEANTPLEVFLSGYPRFHFYWATLLWPWLAAAAFEGMHKLLGKHLPSRGNQVPTACSLCVCIALVVTGKTFNFEEGNHEGVTRRTRGLACLAQALKTDGEILCPSLSREPLRGPLELGVMSGASFSRILPLLPIPAGTDAPAPLFRLSLNRFAHTSNTSCVHDTKDSILNCQEQVDPKIFITSSNSSPLALCYTLEVAVLLRASTADTAELFFSSPLSKRFSPERSSKIAVVGGNDFQELHFFLSSADGFGTEFRLDPVAKTQPFEVKEVEMRCRIGNVLKRENITLPYSPRR